LLLGKVIKLPVRLQGVIGVVETPEAQQAHGAVVEGLGDLHQSSQLLSTITSIHPPDYHV
jgi:hypothetical protein